MVRYYQNMMTRTKKNSAEQLAYFAALAAFQITAAEFRAQCAALPGYNTDAELEAHCAAIVALEDATGYNAARELKLEAELAMVNWARQIIKTDPKTARRYGLVADVFDKGL